MIPCQRHLFDVPDDVAYLNCAFTSPLLKKAEEAGYDALQNKKRPWSIASQDFFTNAETVRSLFAQVVGCSANNVAIIPSVSYGIALAARNLAVLQGQSIVVLEDQFPSNIYSWKRLAAENQAHVVTVKRPKNLDWASAVLANINAETSIVAVAHCHWTDGTLIDLIKIGEKCRSIGAALVVDGTQSLGALPFSITDIRPDFLITTAHKWLLGPYNYGFCYIDAKWLDGVPLEENWMNRAGSEDFSQLVNYCDEYQDGARRFDMGEVSNFILAPVAIAALTQLLQWGVAEIAESLQVKIKTIATRAAELGLSVPHASACAPHMIGITLPDNFNDGLAAALAQNKVYVSFRGKSIRIAPHLHNTDEDVDKLFSVLNRFV